VDHIAGFLKENPSGNYDFALKNAMNIKEESLPESFENDVLYINEGAAVKEASYGIEILANEIISWAKEKKIENLKVFLPSGTGTTALFLQKYLDIEVLTCACVGDEKYLTKQFLQLECDVEKHPTILERKKKFHFGKLYKDNYLLWKEIHTQTQIEFDLLYDPVGWNTLLYNFDSKFTYLYLHQGGLLGNESMIQRYKHKYF